MPGPIESSASDESAAADPSFRGIDALLVEDNPGDARLVEIELEEAGKGAIRLRQATTVGAGLDRLREEPFDVVLLDLSLPDSSGLETFLRVRQAAPDVAVIVLSGMDDEELAVRTVHEGGQDYIVKGRFDGPMLVRAIRYAVERKQANTNLRKLNETLQQANAQIKATQMQLIQAEKMESVGRLASGVAHEVRNPLALMLMGVEFLEGRFRELDDANVKDTLEEMRTAVEKADEIVIGLLEFSRQSALKLLPGDLNRLVEQSLVITRYELGRKKIEAATDLGPDLPRVMFDRVKLEQVLVNAFINAAHAMEDNGALVVRTYTRRLTEDDVPRNEGARTRNHLRPGDRVVVAEIDDNGHGIPQDKLSMIWEPFFTTKATGSGTGLGLSVTKRIIDLHRGLISIANRPEGGVQVRITLQAMKDDAGESQGC